MSLFIAILFLASCSTTKPGDSYKAKAQNVNVTKPATPVTMKKKQTLEGRWTVTGYSVYTTPDKLPNYKAGEVIYEIKGNSITITKNNTNIKNDYTPGPGEQMFWANSHMVKFADQIFMYTLSQDNTGQETLKLDTNIDPSLSPDGAVYHLKRY